MVGHRSDVGKGQGGILSAHALLSLSRHSECIGLAAHWIADEGWGEPDDAASAFDLLADRGVVDREAAATLRAAVGLRNRIAHGYAMLDYERVHREAQTGIPVLRRFLIAIADAAGV